MPSWFPRLQHQPSHRCRNHQRLRRNLWLGWTSCLRRIFRRATHKRGYHLATLEGLEDRSLLSGVTEFVIPTLLSHPYGITAGPDSALWFTEVTGNKIGRISTGGTLSE